MPKISEERRADRRLQILNAAWKCFHRQGLHGTSMADIIRVSGLSAGAVYLYFRSKDDLIEAAVTSSLGEFTELAKPLFERTPPADPGAFMTELVRLLERFTKRGEYSLKVIAIHGWSQALTDAKLKAPIAKMYTDIRNQIARLATMWQVAGFFGTAAQANEVAEVCFSMLLGYMVQSALLDDVTTASHAKGFAALSQIERLRERRA